MSKVPAMVVLWATIPCYSQFLPDLQARTPGEYDAYLDVFDGPVIERAAAFEREYPKSALLLPVLELAAREWRRRGDGDRALSAASRGLAIAPDYIPLLVEFADLAANGPGPLDRAESSARRALELLESAKASRRTSVEEWIAAVARLRARARGAIGLVKFKRGDTAGAIKEFEDGLVASPGEGALRYRLGRLYVAVGRTREARQQLEEAAKSEEKSVRDLARAALAELQQK